MSYYFKRIIVINGLINRQIKGLCTLESFGNDTSSSLSVLNLEPGEYYACFLSENNFIFKSFSGEKNKEFRLDYFSISGGCSALIAKKTNDGVAPVAFGKSGESGDLNKLLSLIKSELKKMEYSRRETVEISKPPEKIGENCYDDEMVATENYFEIEKNAIEEIATEKLEIDKNSDFNFEENIQINYYEKVKADLEKIFSENTEEEFLVKAIPNSKWAKIEYGNAGNYYAVGVIYENNTPEYICYGLPSSYNARPPKELEGYCSFLPASIFSAKGSGYWILYQNAVDGSCVTLK